MQRPRGQAPYRPASDGYPRGLPQPAAAITYQLNGAPVGRGNTLNIVGNGITFIPGPDVGTFNISGSGSFALPIVTDLGGGDFVKYDQNADILGLGIRGGLDAYSDNNFASSFSGSVFGDLSSVGSEENAYIAGYVTLGPGAAATLNIGYNSGSDVSSVALRANSGLGQATIDVTSNGGYISFDFGGGNNYIFPNTTAAGANYVLTDVLGNGTLSWQPMGSSGALTIGDPITGGLPGRILFEDGSNNLAESGDLVFNNGTGEFIVSNSGSQRFLINPASNQYYIGNGGTGDTLVELLDIGGGSSLIRNWVTGRFLVQQGNAGPSLIDGNTSTFNLYLGDVGNNANQTNLTILDSTEQVILQNDGTTTVVDSSGNKILEMRPNVTNPEVYLGDLDGIGGGTNLKISDASGSVTVYATNATSSFAVTDSTGTMGSFNVRAASGLAYIEMGDLGGTGNGSVFQFSDPVERMLVTLNGDVMFQTNTGGGEQYFYSSPNTTILGRNASGNNTNLSIDDTNENMLANLDGVFRYQTTAGNTKFLVDLANNITSVHGSRFQMTRGNNALTAANNFTLDPDGNAFFVNGNTQINLISNSNWQNGSEVVLIFNGTPTLKHNQVASGSFVAMLLAGAVDFTITTKTVMKFLYTDGAWYEIARTII